MKNWLYTIILLSLVGCQEISCPLDNVVVLTMNFYQGGSAVTVGDTMSITAGRTDSVVLNRLYNFSKVTIPVHQGAQEVTRDTLVLHWLLAQSTKESPAVYLRDTLFLSHTCDVHFETIDCKPAVFHQLQEVRCTHQFLDSVSLIDPLINYEDYENLRIHLRSAVE